MNAKQHPSNRPSAENVRELFTYHPPTDEQILKYQRIRKAAEALTLEILACCPGSADMSTAVRKVREAVMTANAAIALEPLAGADEGGATCPAK
jgi:hypothetical protein